MWEESERGARFISKLVGVFVLGMLLVLALNVGAAAAGWALAGFIVLAAVGCVLWLAAGSLLLGTLAAVSRPFCRPPANEPDDGS